MFQSKNICCCKFVVCQSKFWETGLVCNQQSCAAHWGIQWLNGCNNHIGRFVFSYFYYTHLKNILLLFKMPKKTLKEWPPLLMHHTVLPPQINYQIHHYQKITVISAQWTKLTDWIKIRQRRKDREKEMEDRGRQRGRGGGQMIVRTLYHFEVVSNPGFCLLWEGGREKLNSQLLWRTRRYWLTLMS